MAPSLVVESDDLRTSHAGKHLHRRDGPDADALVVECEVGVPPIGGRQGDFPTGGRGSLRRRGHGRKRGLGRIGGGGDLGVPRCRTGHGGQREVVAVEADAEAPDPGPAHGDSVRHEQRDERNLLVDSGLCGGECAPPHAGIPTREGARDLGAERLVPPERRPARSGLALRPVVEQGLQRDPGVVGRAVGVAEGEAPAPFLQPTVVGGAVRGRLDEERHARLRELLRERVHVALHAGEQRPEHHHAERLVGASRRHALLRHVPCRRPVGTSTEEERGRGNGVAELTALDQRGAVDRVRDAAAQRAVGQGPLLGVQDEAGDGRSRSLPDLEARIVGEGRQGLPRDQRAAAVHHEVDDAIPDQRDRLRTLGMAGRQGQELHAGEPHRATPPRVVGAEEVALVRGLVDELVRAAPERALEGALVVVGALSHEEGGVDRSCALLEEWPRFGEHDANGPRVHDVEALEPFRGAEPRVGGVAPPADEVVADGVRVEPLPVVEDDVRIDPQGPGPAVGRDAPVLDQARDERAVRSERDETLVAGGLGLEAPPVDERGQRAVRARAGGDADAE